MSRNKLVRFAANEADPRVVQPGKPIFETIRGQWRAQFFENDRPLVLELACGYGEYTVGLGAAFPDRNFVGVDIKGSRIWKGASQARALGLTNVGFLRIKIQQLADLFAPGEVDEIWITFPDPRPKDRDEKRRLTHPRFLALYRTVMRPDGWLHLKTDNAALFDYTLGVLGAESPPARDLSLTRDLYQSELLTDHRGIRTRYEKLFTAQGCAVHYLRCRIG